MGREADTKGMVLKTCTKCKEENLHKGNRYADINGEKVLREDFNLDEYIKNYEVIF